MNQRTTSSRADCLVARADRRRPPEAIRKRVMNSYLAVLLMVAAGSAYAGDSRIPETALICSESWYRAIEERFPTGDGHGHGPDVGSEEWKSVIEFKLGIRGEPNIPGRASPAWCQYIDRLVRPGPASRAGDGQSAPTTVAPGPSYACDKVMANSTEAMICADEKLSALDRKLSRVYAAASRKATHEHPPVLKAEQRGWIKGRNDCWKSDDQRQCIMDAYRHRIAELQARYQLVPGIGPVRFVCDGNPVNEVVATFFRTDPPTLIAERGDRVSLMYLQPSGSGAKYQGRNETFWEHQGGALITWGYGAPPMRCRKVQ